MINHFCGCKQKNYENFPDNDGLFLYPIYTTPLLRQDMTQGQFFKRILTSLNSEFSFF